jgi:hypothetical protein
MEKLVIVVDKKTHDSAEVARDVAAIPGVSVTSRSRSFVDVEASEPRSVEQLRAFTSQHHGLSLEAAPEPQLMEPISPFKAI